MSSERIDQLSEAPRALAHLVAELTDAAMDTAPVADAWTPRIILAHLRDDEYLCMRPALELALAADGATAPMMAGGDWVAGRNRTRDRKEWLLADFALQRQASISILRSLRAADWERRIDRGEGRMVTLSQHLDAWLHHDAEHVAQLEQAVGETLADVRARRARMADGGG